jgi:hypothetical protein
LSAEAAMLEVTPPSGAPLGTNLRDSRSYRISRSSLRLGRIASWILVGTGGAMAVTAADLMGGLGIAFGLGLSAMGVGALLYLKRTATQAFVLDGDGLRHPSAGMIPWHAMRTLTIEKERGDPVAILGYASPEGLREARIPAHVEGVKELVASLAIGAGIEVKT